MTGLIYGEKKPPAPPQAQHMPIHFAAEAISKPEPELMATEITHEMQKYIIP